MKNRAEFDSTEEKNQIKMGPNCHLPYANWIIKARLVIDKH